MMYLLTKTKRVQMPTLNVKFTEAQLREAVKNATSFSGVLRALGAGYSGSSHQWIKKRITELGIDYSHFHGHVPVSVSNVRKTPDEILVNNPNAVKRSRRRHVLYAMLSKGRKYECEMDDCPNPKPMWRGQPLPLEIDHIDGDWRNNLLCNLRFLCPNCHHQTDSNRRGQAISAATLEEYEIAVRTIGKIACPQCNGPMAKKSKVCYSCYSRKDAPYTKRKDPSLIPSLCPSCGGKKAAKSKACRDCTNRTLGRTPTKVTYPPVDELVSRISQSSVLRVSKELGVSDVALRKYLRNRGVDTKSIKKSKR